MKAISVTALPMQTAPISTTARGPSRAIASLMKITSVALSR